MIFWLAWLGMISSCIACLVAAVGWFREAERLRHELAVARSNACSDRDRDREEIELLRKARRVSLVTLASIGQAVRKAQQELDTIAEERNG